MYTSDHLIQNITFFYVGMLIGSIIDFSGIIILTLIVTGYYYRDSLMDKIQYGSLNCNFFPITMESEKVKKKSWYDWAVELLKSN